MTQPTLPGYSNQPLVNYPGMLPNGGQSDSSQSSSQPSPAPAPTSSPVPTDASGGQNQSTGTVTGAFNATSVPNNNLLSGPFSDYTLAGLPTSDQQMIAELGSTLLYVGMGQTEKPGPVGRIGETVPTPSYSSAADLLKNLEHMSRSDVISMQQQLIAGQWLASSYMPSGIVDAATEAAYLRVLTTAARYQNSGINISPDQLLAESATPGGAGKTTTSTVVDLTDPMTARGVLENVTQTYLGRAANSQDIAGFIQALQGYEAQHPGTSTTTTQVGPGGQVLKESSTQKVGGMGSSLSLRGGDVSAAQEYIDQTHGGEEAQVGVDSLIRSFSQALGLSNA